VTYDEIEFITGGKKQVRLEGFATRYESDTSNRVWESLDCISERVELDEPVGLSAEIVTHQDACAKA
jgi:hypothetical protein